MISFDLKPIYTAPTAADARRAYEEFAEKWGRAYPAIKTLWDNAWSEFIPFLDYDVEIRKVLCSTNAIESLNARYRRAARAHGHFPTEQSAMKTGLLQVRLTSDVWRLKAAAEGCRSCPHPIPRSSVTTWSRSPVAERLRCRRLQGLRDQRVVPAPLAQVR